MYWGSLKTVNRLDGVFLTSFINNDCVNNIVMLEDCANLLGTTPITTAVYYIVSKVIRFEITFRLAGILVRRVGRSKENDNDEFGPRVQKYIYYHETQVYTRKEITKYVYKNNILCFKNDQICGKI